MAIIIGIPTAQSPKINVIKGNKQIKKKEFKNAYRDKILKVIDFNNIKENIIPDKNYDKNIRFTFDSKPTTSPFKDSLVSRSGFSVNTPDEMQADVIVKNYASAAEMYKVDAMNKFNSLKSVVNSKYKQDFENLCIYTMYKLAEKSNPEQATAILDLKENINDFAKAIFD